MKTLSKVLAAAFVFAALLVAQGASASIGALKVYDILGKAGIDGEGAAGKNIREVTSLECESKIAPGAPRAFSCNLFTDKNIVLDAADSQVVFDMISGVARLECIKGTCFTAATQIQCAQVNPQNYDPGHVPSASQRTSCGLLVQRSF